jgi:hypothetical protein
MINADRQPFLADIDAGATFNYCGNHLPFLPAVKSAIRAYAKKFLLGPAHQSGIPAREFSHFHLRSLANTQPG